MTELHLLDVHTNGELREGRAELSLATCPWLSDHRVRESPVLPGAAALVLLDETVGRGDGPRRWEDIHFLRLLELTAPPESVTLLTRAAPSGEISAWTRVETERISRVREHVRGRWRADIAPWA